MKSGLTRRQQVAGLRDDLTGGACRECAERLPLLPAGPSTLYPDGVVPPWRRDDRGRHLTAWALKFRCSTCGYELLTPVPAHAPPPGAEILPPDE